VHGEIKTVETVFLLLLGFVVLFGELARRMKLAYPIVLVIGGLLLSLVPGLPTIRLNPELFFLVVLPPLLFHAAWQTSWREFRYNLVSILLMASGLVIFTVIGVAIAGERLFSFLNWKTGFLLGAILAPTDTIAATAIARRVGLPQQITDILEGESLINDATGLLALEFGLALVMSGETPSAPAGALRLIYLVTAGIGIGLLVAWIVHWLELHIDDAPIELTLGLVSAYTAYIVAEELRASGVLAVITAGFYLSRKSAMFFSPPVRLQAYALWDTIDFVLNGLVFVLIGLQLPLILAGLHSYSRLTLLGDAVAISALVIALRLVWVYPSSYVAFHFRRHILKQPGTPPEAKQMFITGWTGMRGVLALAAALSIPETLSDGRPFPGRDMILFLTFCVILVTLVLQGVTLPWLIRALGLGGASEDRSEEEYARSQMTEAARDFLNTKPSDNLLESARMIEASTPHQELCPAVLLEQYPYGVPTVTVRHRAVSLKFLNSQRAVLLELRSQGLISDTLLRKLERDLDLKETQLLDAQS
jgi:monovalent cation/hydrogen antiporter